MFRPAINWIASAAVVALVLGCSSSDDNRPTVKTGWLGSLSMFERVSGTKGSETGVFVRRPKEAALTLETLYLAPVDVTLAAGSDLQTIEPADIEALRTELARSVRKALDGKVEFVPRPERGSFTLRVALTHLRVGRTKRLGGSDRRAHLRFTLDTTSIQSELREGASNARRAATIATALIDKGQTSTPLVWDELVSQFDEYSALLAAQLETARAALATRAPAPAKT